tara:strand:- start:119 stop:241 length:123 start_codon:yes stop_codon:yes gene_type:complete
VGKFPIDKPINENDGPKDKKMRQASKTRKTVANTISDLGI